MVKKKGKEKKITFNPADYDYFNHLPLEGWIWEFIRRNYQYRKLYSEFIKPVSKREPYYKKPLDHLLREFCMESNRDYEYRYPLDPEQFLIVRNNNPLLKIKKGKRIIDGNVTLGLPNPDIKYTDLKPYKPVILQRDIIATYKLSKDYNEFNYENDNFLFDCADIIYSLIQPTGAQETLLLSIPTISASKLKILKQIERIVKKEVRYKAKLPKKMEGFKRWKFYLMAYDLKESGYPIKDIAKILYPRKSNGSPPRK